MLSSCVIQSYLVYVLMILDVIFVTFTENSSVATNDTRGPPKYPHYQKGHTSITSGPIIMLSVNEASENLILFPNCKIWKMVYPKVKIFYGEATLSKF